jgi:ubiquitin-protein ligase
MNVIGIEKFVGPSTESFFTDQFWESLDLCWNALDNVKARKYTDGRCLFYSKPLLESGTTGTMSNHEVILPYRTSTYNDGVEPPEVGIAMCTLKAFPYLPLHCIEFAKQEMFQERFEFEPEQYESFREDRSGFQRQLEAMKTDLERFKAMKAVASLVEAQTGGVDFEKCVRMAFNLLMMYHRNKILDVMIAGDKLEAEKGEPYWTGVKRRPQPVNFTPDDDLSMEFLYATSNLYAFVFKQDYVRSRQQFDAIVRGMDLVQSDHAAFGGDVQTGDDDEAETFDPEEFAAVKEKLNAVDTSTLAAAQAHDFEKDEDDNYHIDFLTIATNLRAWNYNIKSSERHEVKVIAGRIIAALATTTAMVCGLVDIEFCKIAMGLQNLGIDKFLNSNINLANGSGNFTVFHPDRPIEQETKISAFETFTSWDKIEIDENGRSVGELIQHLEKQYGVTVESLAAEINYNPPQSIEMWRAGDNPDKKLSDIFLQLCASGAKASERSANSQRRVRSELKELQEDPVEGMSVNAKPGDDFVFQFTLEGPAGTPYEGGTFLLEVTLPDNYPNAAPKLAFKTYIDHCNILNGEPCPDLLALASWAPAQKVRSVLMLLQQLLKEQDYTKPLRADLAVLEPDVFAATAKASTAKFATADQTFENEEPQEAADAAPAEPIPWFHDYLIMAGGSRGGSGGCGGEFINAADGEHANLPRIKLSWANRAECRGRLMPFEMPEMSKASAAKGDADESFPEDPLEPVSAEVEAKVKAMDLQLDYEPLSVQGCYKLSADRASRICALPDAAALTAENGVVATCTTSAGETIETLLLEVNGELEHVVFCDPILCNEIPLPMLVEAQFEAGGSWTLSRAGLEGINAEKASLFKPYADRISMLSPDCLATLRRMLQSGPINRIYSGGGSPPYTPSHEGFALRMPAAEVEQWQMLNDKGELADIPRPAHALRVWDATERKYVAVDPFLDGAPRSNADLDAWFVDLVKRLKGSMYIGTELLDKLATSESHHFDAALERPDEFFGTFQNHWSDLIVNTSI